MIWISPSAKDADNAAKPMRLWNAAEPSVPALHPAKNDFDGGRPQGFLVPVRGAAGGLDSTVCFVSGHKRHAVVDDGKPLLVISTFAI